VTISVLPAPPSSRGPGIAKAYPALHCDVRATPRELKAEAIRLHLLTGMSKRELWKRYEGGSRGWSTIQRYLDAGYPKVTPPRRFVQWLSLLVDERTSRARAREFEVASR